MPFPKCLQCDQDGTVYFEEGRPLCIDHAEAMQRMAHNGQAQLGAMLNYLTQQLHQGSPFLGPAPQIQFPPLVDRRPSVVNHINVTGGNVGAINTGTVDSLNVQITALSSADAQLAEAVANFGKAVYESSLQDEVKNEVGEQLEFLLDECAKPTESRRNSVVRATVAGISEAIKNAAALAALWDHVSPLLLS